MSTRAEARSAEQALARLRSHLKLTLNLLLDDTVINLIALRVGEQPVKVRHALELLGGWFGAGRDAGAADAANEADGVDGWLRGSLRRGAAARDVRNTMLPIGGDFDKPSLRDANVRFRRQSGIPRVRIERPKADIDCRFSALPVTL